MRKGFVPLLALALAVMTAGTAQAKSTKGSYSFAISAPLTCTAYGENRAVLGTITLDGSGAFNTNKPRTASGTGNWDWNNATGGDVDQGTWSISKLNNFHSFGGTNANYGGEAQFVATFTGAAKAYPAKLWITNAAGKTPKGKAEGCRVNLKDTINFNKSTSGAVSMTRAA